MSKEKIIAFAKKQGYDGISPLGKWRGYDAYEPTFKGTGEEPAFVGPPLMILVKGNEIRMSTVEEAYAQIDEAEDE